MKQYKIFVWNDVINCDVINCVVIDYDTINCDVINGNRLRGKLISRSRAFLIGKLSKPWWFSLGFHGLQHKVWFYHCISFQNETIRGVFHHLESTDRKVGHYWLGWILRISKILVWNQNLPILGKTIGEFQALKNQYFIG